MHRGFPFSLIPAPPPSALFPYTTLFRSPVLRGTAEPGSIVTVAIDGALLGTTVTDRKSTRLNSSHVAISYAVFCLKKKTVPHPAAPVALLGFLRRSHQRDLQRCGRGAPR